LSAPESTPHFTYRRTKLVATLGPATSTTEAIFDLIQAGVDVFRLNMSHGSHAEHRKRFEQLQEARAKAHRPVAVLADLSGPKIRVGLFAGSQALLMDGSSTIITVQEVLGSAERFSSQYLDLAKDVKPGSRILLDDGNLELKVTHVEGTEIHCLVVHGGLLKDRKGMNLPNVQVSAPALTEKDVQDALFVASLGVDFIALSFVRTADDLKGLRRLLAPTQSSALIVAKIEKPEAVANIEAIVDEADAIMVARGDLGVELDLSLVPNVQEELVDLARARSKPVIVATQMLESMITHARPTRAEVTDVANAVRSGADAVMLSAETAAGNHPLEAVRTMDLIVRRTEAYLSVHGAFGSFDAYTPTGSEPVRPSSNDAEAAIAESAARMSRDYAIRAIVARTDSRSLLQLLSSKRPSAMVWVSAKQPVLRAIGCLSWGLLPLELSFDDAPQALVRTLQGAAELETLAGFWLLVSSNGEKNAELSLLSA
jgi:pyruvate kinase